MHAEASRVLLGRQGMIAHESQTRAIHGRTFSSSCQNVQQRSLKPSPPSPTHPDVSSHTLKRSSSVSDSLQLAGGDAGLSLETVAEMICPACPSCSGGIYLIYDDDATSLIPSDASASDVEEALAGLGTLGAAASVYGEVLSISVAMEGGSSLCESGASVATSIALRSAHGNLPSFAFIGSVRDADGASVTVTYADGNGDKENEYCANHGVCDFATGSCLCDRNTTMFPDEWYWWESSDGYGGPGGRPDCGYQRVESVTNRTQSCPVAVVFANVSSPTYESYEEV